LKLPVTNSALFNAVNAAIDLRSEAHEDLWQSTNFDQLGVRWLPEVRALVVDDSDINREVAKGILERQGAYVVTGSDGTEAVACLREQPEAFDIVLMDVQMPVMDGNAAAVCIRSDLGLMDLPIIALTAGALVSERQRSMDAGMNAFLSKPFDPQVLIRIVRRQVELVRGTTLPIVIQDKKSAAGRTASGMKTIDANTVKQMYGDDEALFKSLLGRVLRDYVEFALPITVDASDEAAREHLKSRLHKFKGSAAVVGASTVQRYAGAAERAIDDGQPPDFVEAILRELAAAFTELREEAQPMLIEVAAPSDQAVGVLAPDAAPMTAAMLDELRELLDTQNLAALDHFNTVADSLKATVGELRFERLREAIEMLDFCLATELLGGAESLHDSTDRSDQASAHR
jgi:CheY-like chemotaxis protein